MPFNATLAAKRRQSARPRSALPRADTSTDNIAAMLAKHRNKVAEQDNTLKLARSQTLSELNAQTEYAEAAAACALARSVSHVTLSDFSEAEAALAAAVERAFESDEELDLVSAIELDLDFLISDVEVSFEDDVVRVRGSVSEAEPDAVSDADSASAHSPRASSSEEDEDEDEIPTPPASPELVAEVDSKNAAELTLSSPIALRSPQTWRSRRVAEALASPTAQRSVAPQQATAQQPTQSSTTASTVTPPSTTATSKIDWSLDEDDDAFFLEPLVFDDCTYSFEANGVARTPTGATEPDALLVAVPTAVRNHSRIFLKEAAYEKAQDVTPTAKTWLTVARAGGSSALPPAAAAVAKAGASQSAPVGRKQGKGRKQQPWRYNAARDD